MREIRVERVDFNNSSKDKILELELNKCIHGSIEIMKHNKIKYISTIIYDSGIGAALYLLMQLEELEMYEDCEYLHKAIERVKWESRLTNLPKRFNSYMFRLYATRMGSVSEFDINQELEQNAKEVRAKINLY